jgi:hypothetical protein
MKAFLILPLVVLATGCGVLAPQIDKAAKGAGKLVTFYCDNVTLPEVRDELRAKVNEYAAPNSIAVTCASGGPVLKSGN